MPTIGNREVNLHTVDRDETVYAGSTNTVSHSDMVALRRTPPSSPEKPLRTNVRFERGFSVANSDGMEKLVTVSIAVTLPPGIDTSAAKSYVTDSLVQAATLAGEVSITGDIHL